MGTKFLIDSNAIIDFLADRLPPDGAKFLENLIDSDFIVSVIVKIEVLGYHDIADRMKLVEEFLTHSKVLTIDESLTVKAIELRRMHRKLKLGDAIIAATAMAHGLGLVTRNTVDFERIDGLVVLNPHHLG